MQALALWDLSDATLEPIKIRENAVYRVVVGRRSVGALRVHRPGYHDDAALRSEFIWMRALESSGIAVPRPIQSRKGADFEIIRESTRDPSYQVDILEWIAGHPLGTVGKGVAEDVLSVEAQYESIGNTMARIHNQAEHWRPPPGFKRHAWDAAGLVGAEPFWGRFWELRELSSAQRALLQAARSRIVEALAPLGNSSDRYGLIHADLIPENVLVDGLTQRVIDFDDAGFGWHMFDIATSVYFLIDETYYESALAALVRGYRRERPLADAMLALLPIFMAARGTTYVGWLHTRQGSQAAMDLSPLLIRLGCEAATRMLEAKI